ncbi:MAG: hypothetical protein ACREP2_14400 [Rhodanobacteraceae bacterium]
MVPPKTPWLVGVDDFATETQECAGWTFFAIQESQAKDFEKEGRHILGSHGLSSFHGKKFKEADRVAFKDFLNLIRSVLQQEGRACNSLVSKALCEEMIGFARRITGKFVEMREPRGKQQVESIIPYAPILFMAVRALRSLGQQSELRFFIDEDSSLPDISESKLIAIPAHCSFQTLLRNAVNDYRNVKFKDGPYLAAHPVEKMPDGKSILIQAADVLANFSMSHVFSRLGNKSKKRIAKSELLQEVFHEAFNEIDFPALLDLNGNDFQIKEGGAINFEIDAPSDG